MRNTLTVIEFQEPVWSSPDLRDPERSIKAQRKPANQHVAAKWMNLSSLSDL
jgi:hypothetical protein